MTITWKLLKMATNVSKKLTELHDFDSCWHYPTHPTYYNMVGETFKR